MKSMYLVAIILCSYAISSIYCLPACSETGKTCPYVPCKVNSCPAYPEAVCVNNYCDDCSADYYVDGVIVDCYKPEPPKCDGKIEDCVFLPCKIYSCPAYPNAVCVNNFCGGCMADYYVDGVKVDCNKPEPPKCDGKIEECLFEPCKISSCPAHPDAKCVNNYCNGCVADYYMDGVKVDCRKPAPAPPKCDGTIVDCFVAPCRFSKCPTYPNATCVNNYCNGCFADFYVNGAKVNCTKPAPTTKCTGKIVECLVAPCRLAKCPAHPDAVCVDNYCDGCNAEFYVNGVKVDDCGSDPTV